MFGLSRVVCNVELINDLGEALFNIQHKVHKLGKHLIYISIRNNRVESLAFVSLRPFRSSSSLFSVIELLRVDSSGSQIDTYRIKPVCGLCHFPLTLMFVSILIASTRIT